MRERKRVFWMYNYHGGWYESGIHDEYHDFEAQVHCWLQTVRRGERYRLCYGYSSKPESAVVLAEITR